MKLWVLSLTLLFSTFSSKARAEITSETHQKSIEFVKVLFQRAKAASKALAKETILNGLPQQEGFCKLVEDSVLMDKMVPYVAGKETWEAANEQERTAFTQEAFTNLSIFISLGFQNYTQNEMPNFIIDPHTTDSTIVVKAIIPNDQTDMIIRLRQNENGDLRMFDSVINGISTMQLKKADFASAAKVSMANLIATVAKVNARVGYGKCQLN